MDGCTRGHYCRVSHREVGVTGRQNFLSALIKENFNVVEASTVLFSVVKHAGSGRARKKCRGQHETQSSVFPPC